MLSNLGRQVLWRTVRNASLCSPLTVKTCQSPSLQLGCRLLCSTVTSADQTDQDRHGAALLSLRSLLDMGFTDSQASQIHGAVSALRGASAAQQALSTLTVLFGTGLNPASVLKLLDKCPELFSVRDGQLQQRINNLRRLGLGEGSLQRMVVHYPKILTVPVKSVKTVVLFLREKCLFTFQQITQILRDSPAVVLEDPGQLEYKFQYVYFRMGVKQSEMVKFRLFRFTLEEVRCRHSFLERRGFYQTPDKKGQTTIINPKLESVLHVDLDAFLTQVAKASAEEYDVYQRLLVREWKEEEVQQGRVEADDDDDDDDDEDDENEDEERQEHLENPGKSGYRKNRNRKKK
ncbi:transcription termination factor 4, mitochondrial [Cololabis saira]|uniref:transcription termination factor 4, mitochondrial n=1 Tax=Cololabis saira TaxID=129043 RepID=UPI002AD4F918|nr:transcription termination factor 4, mitochondrial [Cololabis saira]